MLAFSLFSGLCCFAVSASFVLPWFALESGGQLSGQQAMLLGHWEFYVLLSLFYFCNYFVMMYFNAALVACALIRLGGKDPTIGEGLRVAAARVPQLLGWSLIAATVGMLLRLFEERSQLLARIVVGLIGIAFSLASSMVVPILVVEKKDALTALRESTALLKQTWGEQLVSRVSFGLVFGLLSLAAIPLALGGLASGNMVTLFLLTGLALVYLIFLALVQCTLQGIFQAALYAYARHRMVPAGYDATLLQKAIAPKLAL